MSVPAQTTFFDYYCSHCDAPFCERVHLMNLALDYVDDEFCLDCLAKEETLTPQTLADNVYPYIQARDCFKTPWEKFDAGLCPKQSTQECFCQNVSSNDNPTSNRNETPQ